MDSGKGWSVRRFRTRTVTVTEEEIEEVVARPTERGDDDREAGGTVEQTQSENVQDGEIAERDERASLKRPKWHAPTWAKGVLFGLEVAAAIATLVVALAGTSP
ncbi:hypothetical protein ACFW6S_10650 [Streptomyces sp. NPDC058740]|uniref:hypothetical protein n=1 Tax=unclassified Streptomyces TaxID=2593676 RepID=UPI00369B439D